MTLIHSFHRPLPLDRSRVADALDARGNKNGMLDESEVADATLDEFKELMGDVAEAAGHRREDAFRLGEARTPPVVETLISGVGAGVVLAGVASAVFPPLVPVALAAGPILGVAATASEVQAARKNNGYANAADELKEAFKKARPDLATKLR